MIKPEDILAGKSKLFIKALIIGETGSGKTHFAATFPKSYFLITEPDGEVTWMTLPELRRNVIGYDKIIPENVDDTKRFFDEQVGEFYLKLREAKELAKKGDIETVVLDNITYLGESLFIYLDRFFSEFSARTGEKDAWAAYGKLARRLYNIVALELASIPANVVVTAHQELESDETMAKKPDKTNPVVPSLLGGFRDKIGGLFSSVLYIAKREEGGKYHYFARTNMGQGRNAKSRFPNMPAVVENISYSVLKDVILKSINPPKIESEIVKS